MQRPTKEMISDMTSFITITLNPKHNDIDCRHQFIKTFTKLQDFLKNHCLKYLLVAELTKEANIHYHGVLKLKPLMFEGEDLSELHLYNEYKSNAIMRNTFGFMKLDNYIASFAKAYEYLTKDLTKTYGMINNTRTNKSNHNIWTYWVSPYMSIQKISQAFTPDDKLDTDINSEDELYMNLTDSETNQEILNYKLTNMQFK